MIDVEEETGRKELIKKEKMVRGGMCRMWQTDRACPNASAKSHIVLIFKMDIKSVSESARLRWI